MTHDEVCDLLLRLGGKEYRDRTQPEGARCFGMARFVDAPKCACNERAPSLHAVAYPDFYHPSTGDRFDGTVEFDVAGEAGDGRWLRAKLHSVRREDVADLLPDAVVAMRAVWCAFAEALRPREPQSPRWEEQDVLRPLANDGCTE